MFSLPHTSSQENKTFLGCVIFSFFFFSSFPSTHPPPPTHQQTTMSGRAGGKAKPLKAPKKKVNELDEVSLSFSSSLYSSTYWRKKTYGHTPAKGTMLF